MVYSVEEKQKIDHILSAFHSYIQAHSFFDVVYSEKVGYIRMQVNDSEEGEGLIFICSADHLLDVLFNEIINDVRFDEGSEPHYSSKLSAEDTWEARRRITEILNTLGKEADHCLDFLDTYLKNYPDNGAEYESI